MRRRPGIAGWTVTVLACVAGTAAAAPAPEGVLAAGTPYETPYYRLAGEPAAPVAILLGGVHGDETAGYLAARILLQGSVRGSVSIYGQVRGLRS